MRKSLNNDYVLSIISKALNIMLGFLSLILLNRYLGVELKGKYTYILNYTTILSAIFQLGISAIYPKFKRKKLDNCYEIFVSLSIIQFIVYAILSFVIIVINKFNINIFWILIITIISIITSQLRYINLVDNYKYNCGVTIFAAFVNLIITFLIYLLFNANMEYMLIVYLLKDLTFIILLFGKVKIKKLFKREYFKIYLEIIKEGILPMLANLLIMLNYKIDIIMLNGLDIDFYQIGLYSVGLSIAEYLWIIPDIFKDVIQKRSAVNNPLDSINLSIRLCTTSLSIIFAIFLLFGKFGIGIMFGKEYIESFLVTVILFIGVYAMVFFKIISPLFISDNKSKQYFLILLVGALTNITANYILIPKYSIMGAAIASVISYSIIGFVFLKFYLKYYNIKCSEVMIIKRNDIKKILQKFKMRGAN